MTKRLFIVLLPTVLMFFIWPVAASVGVCGPNNNKALTALIPDAICVSPNGDVRPYACNMPYTKFVSFRSACEQHDDCYGTKGELKSDCDTRFYKSLIRACRAALSNDFPEKGRKSCYQWASHYNDKVRQKGCPSYQAAQSSLGVRGISCNGTGGGKSW